MVAYPGSLHWLYVLGVLAGVGFWGAIVFTDALFHTQIHRFAVMVTGGSTVRMASFPGRRTAGQLAFGLWLPVDAPAVSVEILADSKNAALCS